MIEQVNNDCRRLHCPLCNSANVHRLGNLGYSSPVQFSSHIVRLSKVPELWKCCACNSWYSNNIIPEKSAADLYARGISGKRWSQEPVETGKPDEIVELLSASFIRGRSVLDIGCNTGEVLDLAKAKGCITAGVEFSTDCHVQLKNKGHKYYSDLQEVDSKYDVIVAFDIIEHIHDVPLFIESCNRLLSDSGIIIMLTGDISSLSARWCKSKWWYVNYPEHITFPSRKYINNIAGFRTMKVIRTYAARNYMKPVRVAAENIISAMYKKKYNGLPSLGADHIVICLRKCC